MPTIVHSGSKITVYDVHGDGIVRKIAKLLRVPIFFGMVFEGTRYMFSVCFSVRLWDKVWAMIQGGL